MLIYKTIGKQTEWKQYSMKWINLGQDCHDPFLFLSTLEHLMFGCRCVWGPDKWKSACPPPEAWGPRAPQHDFSVLVPHYIPQVQCYYDISVIPMALLEVEVFLTPCERLMFIFNPILFSFYLVWCHLTVQSALWTVFSMTGPGYVSFILLRK